MKRCSNAALEKKDGGIIACGSLFCCIPSCSDNPNSIVYSASSHHICAVSHLLHISRPGNPFCSVERLRWHGRCFHTSWGCLAIIFSLSGVIGLLFRNCEESAQMNFRNSEHREISGWDALAAIQGLKVKCISKHLVVNACPGPANLQV